MSELFRSYKPYENRVCYIFLFFELCLQSVSYSLGYGICLTLLFMHSLCIAVVKFQIGCIYQVLVTEEAHDGEHLVGHNKFYEQILLPKVDSVMGQMLTVKIVSSTKHSMEGVIIRFVF